MTGNGWGLRYRASRGQAAPHNPYRAQGAAVSELALLNCSVILVNNGSNGVSAELEPHGEQPPSAFSMIQGEGGPFLRRNYLFGDGHVTYIERDTRTFTTADRF